MQEKHGEEIMQLCGTHPQRSWCWSSVSGKRAAVVIEVGGGGGYCRRYRKKREKEVTEHHRS